MTSSAADLISELSQRIAASLPAASADAEAYLIATTVTGHSRGDLTFADISAEQRARATEIAAERARTGRPLQYILGTAVSGALDLAVGPGVFIPRPETELIVDWALRQLPPSSSGDDTRLQSPPVVVDLCAGSGTLALEIAHARPDVTVHAVEREEAALEYLRRNAADRQAAGDTAIHIHAADATDPALLAALQGTVEMVVTNPPYIPAAARLPREVVDFEPATALFGGESGNDVIQKMVPIISTLLRPGGTVACEHDDSTGAEVAALFAAHPSFGRVENHNDLSGRPRFVTACKKHEQTSHERTSRDRGEEPSR